ncbi:amino acid adenylation domain-containing protein [Dapis sp. BLCC M229]|uniref:non-ribosomal peptide synthetase n=1 Tax=Dapis sp. BLCC M229 TaxID=3400188 RepID=UPI003CF64477
MELIKFLQELTIQGWQLWSEGERLRYRAPQEESTESVLSQLKQHKREILELLHSQPDILQVYPLSYGQRALWFLWQLAPDSGGYNISFAARIRSLVDFKVWHQVFQELRERHPILCSTFPNLNQEPIQQVDQNQELDLLEINASSWSEEELQEKLLESHYHPFTLDKEAVMRVRWFTRSEEEHILLLTIHHIAWDGWSMELSVAELSKLYQAKISGEKLSLSTLKYSYKDYVYWQREMLDSAKGEKLWKYWQQKLVGELPELDLPTDRQRPPIQTYNGASYSFSLPEQLSQELRELASIEGVTLYMILLATFQVLLYRYTGQEDILVGSPTLGRGKPEFASIVGYFVNPIVLRANLSGNQTFKEFLDQVRQTVLEAIAHQDYPLALLVEKLQPIRDPSRSPIFQVMFTLIKLQAEAEGLNLSLGATQSKLDWRGLKLETLAMPSQEGVFDLSLEIVEKSSHLVVFFKYNTDLFERETIVRIGDHFQTLLEGIVTNPEQSVEQIPIITATERKQLVIDWNNTFTEYPTDKCIHELFEEQVKCNPQAVAVVFEDQQLTYQQLNCRANQLAHYLQTKGVKPEVLVGICMERSLEMMVGLLGILKAGGAYVPLDPNYPSERLAYMLSDAAVSLLVTQDSLVERLPKHQTHVVCLDSDWEAISAHTQENSVIEVKPDNLAYVIYTSGSTGKPKGVAIEHHSPLALCHWAKEVFTIKQEDGVLASTSICFDLSVFEIFVTLSCGGKVILAKNALDLPNVNKSEEVTLINTVPSAITELLRIKGLPSNVRIINLAGETFSNRLVQELYKQESIQAVYNLYGPSEDTTYSTFSLLKKGSTTEPTIGCPIANTQIYILDHYQQPLPIGIPGELYIGGAGLARGYLNRPELTAEKFIPNPFDNKIPSQKSKLYKTGDLACYLPDGNLRFLGRIDHQVKIRGFRIELGEIEVILGSHPQVQKVVVMAREDASSNKILVAYIGSQGLSISNSDLRNFLKQKLPEYMIPSAFVILETIPLNPNGKVNRKALPSPEGEFMRKIGFVSPRTPTEKIVANIFASVLKNSEVSIYDNFFELGGHSLLANQVIYRIPQELGVELPLTTIFELPTVAELSDRLETISNEKSLSLAKQLQIVPTGQLDEREEIKL